MHIHIDIAHLRIEGNMELLQGLFETFFIIKNMINKNIIVCRILIRKKQGRIQ